MLRTLARTAIILAVAAAVAGGLYLAVPSGSPSPSAGRQRAADAASPDDMAHGRDGRPPHGGEHHGREEVSPGRGVAGIAGTTLQMGAVGGVVVALQRRRRRREGGAVPTE